MDYLQNKLPILFNMNEVSDDTVHIFFINSSSKKALIVLIGIFQDQLKIAKVTPLF